MINREFEDQLNKLNKRQKEAVDSIDGPVMVVAGPGTGKTQVLSLRIGNILKKTDTPAESILCLTFTNSGVEAMKNRLEKYIGSTGLVVKVATFHSFCMEIIEKYHELLDFELMPTIMGDEEPSFLIDDILNNNEWEYFSSTNSKISFFNDIKQLISLLKRERISPGDFVSFLDAEIKDIESNPDNISSRGQTKGELKQAFVKRINSLEKTREVIKIYELYEDQKRKLSMIDYDDVLENAVYLVENFEEVKNDIRENYLYVLVDEHQDSSGIQNSFLKAVWKDTENPNIFVVGDDRQLIYGFSGANSSYFEEFSHVFGKAKLIFLNENYRSTSPILLLADELLSSSISKEKLNSNKLGDEKILLNQYVYPRDEIIGAGLYFKDKIQSGLNPNECAILVSKNSQVKNAINILKQMGLPVADAGNISLFKEKDADALRIVLKVISNPFDFVSISKSILDKTSGVDIYTAYEFLKKNKNKELTLKDLSLDNEDDFSKNLNKKDKIKEWGSRLEKWIKDFESEPLSNAINILGNELLINEAASNKELIKRVEIVRSFIHLAISFENKNKHSNLASFVQYLDRLDLYNANVAFATFGQGDGVRVMTLHKSKGLEFEAVWIAHVNEETLLKEKNSGISLPEKIREFKDKKTIEEVKRELYVAITRAKSSCVISYADKNYNGVGMNLVSIIKDMSDVHFQKKTKDDTESELLSVGPDVYTKIQKPDFNKQDLDDVKKIVKDNYPSLKVSVSMLNNFFECPWKWYFRNFLQVPEIKSKHLSLGSVVHGVIDFILKSPDLPDSASLENKIDKEIEKENIEDASLSKNIKKDAQVIVSNWIQNYYNLISKDRRSEWAISFADPDFPKLTMFGKIDLAEGVENGNIYVTDFKTGSSKTKNIIEKIDEDGRMSGLLRQLTMYSYLLNNDKRKYEVSDSRLLFLEEESSEKNSVYSTHIDQDKINLLKKDIRDYEQSLIDGSFVDMDCNVNTFGQNVDECEYCKMAKRILMF